MFRRRDLVARPKESPEGQQVRRPSQLLCPSYSRPDDETAVRNLVEALRRFGRKSEALAEADRFVKHGKASAALYAQRAFIRRDVNDLSGAALDFSAAIADGGLTADQMRSVRAGLAEIQNIDIQSMLDRAQSDLVRGDFVQASDQAALILASNPDSEPAMRIRVEALTGAGKKREARAEVDQFMQRGVASVCSDPADSRRCPPHSRGRADGSG